MESDSDGNIEQDQDYRFQSTGPDPEQRASQKNTWKQLESALSQIPAINRSSFVLREIEGLSFREISSLTNVSVNTAKSRCFRAKQALKLTLADPDAF